MIYSMLRASLVLAALPLASSFGVPLPSSQPAVARSAVRSTNILLQGMPDGFSMGNTPMPGQEGSNMKIQSEETYGMMLSTLLKTEKPIKGEISANYAMVDYQFLQKLEDAIAEGKDENKVRLAEIKEAVNEEMASRMQAAAEALRDVLTSPTPVIMEGKIAGLARQGRLDDAVMQLLQANLEQAEAAGEQGKGAVAVMTKLKNRVQTEMDTKLAPPMALLRQLLRMDDPVARESLLRDKMAPKQAASVILTDMSGNENKEEDLSPDVPPRLLAQAIGELKSRFGNVDESYDTGFVQRLEAIGEEAEAVALALAGGKELTAQQQQDMMWEKAFVSVWDLEQVEEEAHQDGRMAVWEQEAQDQMARQDQRDRQAGIGDGGLLQ